MPGQMKRRVARKAPKRYKKRTVVKRRPKPYRTDPVGMIGFPKQRIVKMRFTKNFNITPAGAASFDEFSTNDINNPDLGTGGARPLGYNQWSSFYKNWMVIGSRIKIKPNFTALPDVGTGFAPAVYGITVYNSGESPTTDPLLLIEQGKCKYRTMQPILNGTNYPITSSFSPKRWYHMKNLKDNWNELSGVFSTNSAASGPSKVGVFSVFAASADGTSTLAPINFLIQIDYLVLVQEPLLLPTSDYTP